MKIVSLICAVIGFFVVSLPSLATDKPVDLINRYEHQNELCRGGYGDNPFSLDAKSETGYNSFTPKGNRT